MANRIRSIVLAELGIVSLKDSSNFLIRKRPNLAHYEDVQSLGMDLAEHPNELRGVEYHFTRIRARILKSFAAKQIFIGTGLLDELILGAAKDPNTSDLVEAVVDRIFRAGIHKPGALVVPLHSFGIAGFGFFRHYRKAELTVDFPKLGIILTPQTNDLNATLRFVDDAARKLKLRGRVSHDSIRHYHRTRSTSWLVANPMLMLRVRGASASNYENQKFFVHRLHIATSLIFVLVALTSDFSDGSNSSFGSTANISNLETLDIKHYVLLETAGRRKRKLRSACVPIHLDKALFSELMNLNVDLNLEALRRCRATVLSAITLLSRMEKLYFAHLFDEEKPKPRLVVHRKIFDSLAYFRRSFRTTANTGEPFVNLAIAFEMLLNDEYRPGVKERTIRRLRTVLGKTSRRRLMCDEVARVLEARGETVHYGQPRTQVQLGTARKAYAFALIHLAKLSLKHKMLKTNQPVGEILGDL